MTSWLDYGTEKVSVRHRELAHKTKKIQCNGSFRIMMTHPSASLRVQMYIHGRVAAADFYGYFPCVDSLFSDIHSSILFSNTLPFIFERSKFRR